MRAGARESYFSSAAFVCIYLLHDNRRDPVWTGVIALPISLSFLFSGIPQYSASKHQIQLLQLGNSVALATFAFPSRDVQRCSMNA